MGVDKILQIDLTQLTREGANQLTSQFDDIIKQSGQSQQQKQKGIPKGKNTQITKFFQKTKLGTLISFSKNPLSFISGFITKLVPVLGPALLATGVIAAVIKKLDNFQKQFVDRVDDRIDAFRSKEQQAEIQAGLVQLIITTSTGSAEPRDAYNTFDVFNTDQSKIETDFQIRNTSGVN